MRRARGSFRASITAAQLVSEIGDRRERYPSSEAMAADAGMCPVAVESGKRRVATFRRACDKRLRAAVSTLADTTPTHAQETSTGRREPAAVTARMRFAFWGARG